LVDERGKGACGEQPNKKTSCKKRTPLKPTEQFTPTNVDHEKKNSVESTRSAPCGLEGFKNRRKKGKKRRLEKEFVRFKVSVFCGEQKGKKKSVTRDQRESGGYQ